MVIKAPLILIEIVTVAPVYAALIISLKLAKDCLGINLLPKTGA